MEDLKFYQDKMDKTMEVLLADYGTIRAGRANPHVLDKIKVDYYGTPTPLQQIGNVSVLDHDHTCFRNRYVSYLLKRCWCSVVIHFNLV